MRTLVIAADSPARAWLSKVISQRGHEATMSDDAEAGCAACGTEAFPVVIFTADALDDQGIQLCRRLRAAAPGQCTILALCQREDAGYLPALLAAGADDYLIAGEDVRLHARLAAAACRAAGPPGQPAGEETRAEAALRQTNAELEAIYDGMSDGILIADIHQERFLRTNPAICRLLGYAADELLSMSVPAIHPADELARVLEVFAAIGERRTIRAESIGCLRKDGNVIYADIAVNSLVYRNQPCAVGFFRDVTEQKRAVDLLRIQRDLGIALSSDDNLSDALERVLEATCRIAGIDCGSLHLVDEATGDVHLATHRGLSPAFAECVSHFAAGSLEAATMTAGKSHYDGVHQVGPRMLEARRREGASPAVAIIPIRHEGRAIACLVVASRTQKHVSLSARHALEAIAARLGGVIARLEAEEALRDSNEKFDTFVCRSPYGYVELDLSGRLLFANQRAADIFAYSIQEALGSHFTRFVDESEIPRAAANLQLVAEGVDVGPLDYMGRTKDGSRCFVQITAVPLAKRARRIGFQLAMLDITDRKQAEQALREHDAKLRSLFQNLPDMVLMLDRDGVIQFANHGVPGAPVETLVGAGSFGFAVPEHQPAYRQCVEDVFAKRQTGSIEVLDIFGLWWSCRLVPMWQDGQVPCAMVICTDITEQKKAAEALQKEQQLLRQLLDLHERDRRLIAYEIHDGFAQQLTAAMYNFESFDRLQSQQPEKARESFDAAMHLVRKSISECRRLISGLRPPILDEFGIVAALEYLICEGREQGGAEITFEHDVRFSRLAPPLESAIFRIVQESLVNARRHSQSQKVRVEMHQRGDRLYVDVRDWGVGFDPARVQEGRFGLQGIRERARLLGGQITIVTAPQQGTHISVELPAIEQPPEPGGGT